MKFEIFLRNLPNLRDLKIIKIYYFFRKSNLEYFRIQPLMIGTITVVCMACLPLAGAAASPAMCVGCGILVAKTMGV